MGSQSGNVEFFSSKMNGSVYSIYGNQKITISGMTGTTSLQYYCASVLDPNLNYFTGPKTNNCAIAQAQNCSGLQASADVAVTKSVSAPSILAGQPLTYTITVSNAGPSAAENVVLTDNLPAGITVTGTNATTGTWTAPTWTIGAMNAGATATLTIQATAGSQFSGTLTNTATVTSTTPDPNTSNNTSTVNTTVTIPVGPTANDDNGTTSKFTPITLNVLANDTPGSSSLNPATVTFVPGTEPNPSTVGVFTADPVTGMVTFTPAGGFTGDATITYTVCDMNNLCDNAIITVSVVPGYSIFFPAAGPGTLAYEDLWPSRGDYDFNDLIVDYRFEVIANMNNYVEEVKGTFTVRAYGASFKNGFGFQFPAAIDPDDLTVTGYDITESYITLSPNGVEAGQSKPTMILFDNCQKQLPHPGTGIGVNVTPGLPYVAPKTLNLNIVFKPNTYTVNDLDIGAFNPFLIRNMDRSYEVHLPFYPPTDLANPALFGTFEDDSNPGTGRYYVTESNLPWALNIYESFDYPIEKQEVIQAYLKFSLWVSSGGAQYPDWYKNLPGYRNDALIYQP